MPKPAQPWLWIVITVLAAVILPRMLALGYFPHLDDGYHAFMAQYIQGSYASGRGFPAEVSGFKLFPVLFFWVWSLPGNALFWLRLADLLAASAAGFLFCIMLVRESGSRACGIVLALAFLLGLNLPAAIDSGFKNSFSPAFACFFLAINLVRYAPPASPRWFWAGVLAATGVLFRETFFFFPLLGCAALLWARNKTALWRFALGGAIGALAITILSAAMRGQFTELFDFYFRYGRIYEPEEWQRWQKFLENGQVAARAYWPLLLIFFAAFAASLWRRCLKGRAFFWLGATILPLFEPMLKIGFLYHFSVCLAGMAGFCAWAYASLAFPLPWERKLDLCAIAAAALCMAPLMAGHFAKAPVTWEVVRHFPAHGWPDSLAGQSNTLEAAKKIHELLPQGGSVASTAFAYFIFPASQTLPPALDLGDLSRAYIFSGYEPARFKQRFNQDPPDLVLLANAASSHIASFETELRDMLATDPSYRYVATVPHDSAKNYGWLGYDFYRREDAAKGAQKEVIDADLPR